MPYFRNHKNFKLLSFNITPVIDIIFLLIVFFVLDFQFLGNDSDNIELPDKCQYSNVYEEALPDAVIIKVTKNQNDEIEYFINDEKVNSNNNGSLTQKMVTEIKAHFKDLPVKKRIVILRIDKNLDFASAGYAIKAASASTASKIKIATQAKD